MNNIDIDSADRKTINAHKGYTVGFNSEMIPISILDTELVDRFKNHLSKAKGILIYFTLNEDQSLHSIGDVMEQIHDIISSDTDIIFSTETEVDIELDKCRFNILLTGLEKIS